LFYKLTSQGINISCADHRILTIYSSGSLEITKRTQLDGGAIRSKWLCFLWYFL